MAKRKDKRASGAGDAKKRIKKLKKRRDKLANKLADAERELQRARPRLGKKAGAVPSRAKQLKAAGGEDALDRETAAKREREAAPVKKEKTARRAKPQKVGEEET